MKFKCILFSSLLFIMWSCRHGDKTPVGLDAMKLDFSAVFTDYQDAVYGYIGENYQRFYIHFDSIVPQDSSYLSYKVWGKVKTKGDISQFSGELRIGKTFEVEEDANDEFETERTCSVVKYGIDSELTILVDSCMKETGRIEGKLESYFYIKEHIPVFYDIDLEYNDAFCNNQFSGEWIPINGSGRKKCCWGTYRIPDCGDLDAGAAEFSPNPKYHDNGWESLIRAFETGADEDWARENAIWW